MSVPPCESTEPCDFELPRPVRHRRQWRACLRCRRRFRGRGPGERVCGPCKETAAWRDAQAVTKGFIEW